MGLPGRRMLNGGLLREPAHILLWKINDSASGVACNKLIGPNRPSRRRVIRVVRMVAFWRKISDDRYQSRRWLRLVTTTPVPRGALNHFWYRRKGPWKFWSHFAARCAKWVWACPLRSWCVATRTANRNRSTLQNLTTDCPDAPKFSASTNRLGDLCKKTRNSPIRAIGVIRRSPDP